MDIQGTNNSDTLVGTSQADMISGLAGNDVLHGAAGDDTLDGGTGADVMFGGDGDDIYVVDDAQDAVNETSTSGGTDTVRTTLSKFSLNDFVENLTLLGSANSSGSGNALNNLIIGNSGNNMLRGGGGADTLIGGAGDDTYRADSLDTVIEFSGGGIDWINAVDGSSIITLPDFVENLYVMGTGYGNDLDNLLRGHHFTDDYLDGGLGADRMEGSYGDDTYVVDNPGDVVVDYYSWDSNLGNDTVLSSISYSLHSSLENLTLTGGASINGYGNDKSNILIGNSANNTLDGGYGKDVLDGGLGADIMIGGEGNDSYYVDDAGDAVNETGSDPVDRVFSTISFALNTSVENLTLIGDQDVNASGNELNNLLTGNSGANRLKGGAGDDTLDGGGGADIMEGGVGDDIYVVDQGGDAVIETSAQGGVDTVRSSISFALNHNVENLALDGNAALSGSGNDLDNTIVGNAGNNRLKGGGGNDQVDGALGNDAIYGGAGNDSLDGGLGDDSIFGDAGNDRLDGGLGADIMQGGDGDDKYYVDSAADSVTELSASGGYDTVVSSITFALNDNVERLVLTGSLAINGSGNALDNILQGNDGNNQLKGGAGNDRLDGGLGADIMLGGEGDDKYYVESAGDSITEVSANGGYDTVVSSISFALNDNIERLVLTGTLAINGSGNALDNLLQGSDASNRLKGGAGADVLQGNGGSDFLDGGVGADTLDGGSGDDWYIVSEAADRVVESFSSGNDTVEASFSYSLSENVENLILTGTGASEGTGNSSDNRIMGNGAANILQGGAGNDTLLGMEGNDTLYGGVGSNRLNGGAGADTFVFNTSFRQGSIDIIEAFSSADDTIWLDDQVFLALVPGELSESAFRVDPATLDADDRIFYDSATGELFYDADGSGAIAAFAFAMLEPGTLISFQDFVVV